MNKNKLIHDIVTSIKFLYPCIAYEENCTDTELTILSETKVSSIYPITKTVNGMSFLGEDYWGRALFKNEKEQYFCEVDGALYFKGGDPEGEPHWTVPNDIIYEYPTIDSELSEFKPCLEKLKAAFQNHENVELISTSCSVEIHPENIRKNKILCTIKFNIKHS